MKKRTKKLFGVWAEPFRRNLSQNIQKFFASFFQKRRPSFFGSPGILRLLLVTGFAVVLILRMPDVLHGRLWAEEGIIFFARAGSLPWWPALFQSYGGYLNIVANAASIIAFHSVRLEYAPLVTTAIGLVFQCFPAILLVCSRDEWLKSTWAAAGALLIISTPPMVGEVWLQSLHSQFHLTLCCALILALDIPAWRLGCLSSVALFLAPLCGPAASALLPLFLARSVIDRSWPRLFQTLFLAGGTLAQLVFFFTHQAGRAYELVPLILLCDIYVRQILAPLAGWTLANTASQALQASLARHAVPWLAVLVTIGAFMAMLIGVWRRGSAAFVWLFLAACTTTLVCYFGALDTGMALLKANIEGRYTFLEQVLAGLTLVGIATGTSAPDRWIARALVGWLIVIGVLYMSGFPPVRGPAWTVNWYIHGPDWRHEVALWRLDETRPLGVWPTGWTMTLPRK